jgi:hypothetical protein
VALLVVLCGCPVGAARVAEDAATPRGDGLPERVTTDIGLWADVRLMDSTAADRQGGGNAGDVPGGDTAGADTGDASSPSCALLEPSCAGRQACYPYPFEGTPSGETRCSFPGIGRMSVPCQSQLECDDDSVCVTPGQPDALCLQRCSVNAPDCPLGTACLPLAGYPGVGACVI